MMNTLLDALSDPTVLMSLIIFLPTVAAFVLLFFPKGQDETMKQFSFITTIIVFALTVWIALPGRQGQFVGFSLSTDQMQFEVVAPLDSRLSHQLPSRPGRHQPAAGRAHLVPQRAGHVGQLADPKTRPRLLHPLPALGNGHAGRLHVAGLLPLLRLLGSDAPADVLSHRRLGRAAAGIRGDQVLPLHARGQRADADRPADALLHQRRPSARSRLGRAAHLQHRPVGQVGADGKLALRANAVPRPLASAGGPSCCCSSAS